MAGGYKHGKYSFTGADIGTADTERCATVLKGCAQVLLDLNVGWSLDTSLNATLNDYTNASSTGSDGDSYYSSGLKELPCYMLFFTSTSGAKLCMGYRYGFTVAATTSNSYGYRNAIPRDQWAGNAWSYGLFVSIIPPGVNDTFSKTSPYRPESATLFIGTARTQILNSANGTGYNWMAHSFAATSGSDITYDYHIISNGLNVIVLNYCDVSGAANIYRGFICGRLVTSFVNDGDTNGFGTIALADSGAWTASTSSTNNWFEYYTSGSTFNVKNGINAESSFFSGQYSYDTELYRDQSIKSADNSKWITGAFTDAGTSTASTLYGPRITANTFNLTSGISAANRWVPIMMYGCATAGTLDQYGVTSETCLKGWIDPDLARIVNNNSTYQRGQTFANGNLVYIGAGLAIGWDASNTTSIF